MTNWTVTERRDGSAEKDMPTVLYVDDGHGAAALADILTITGEIDVLFAPDGQTALAMAAEHEHRIDLLLTDFDMPGINGGELIRRVRETIPGLPAILFTGRDDLRMEGITVLRKPQPPAAIFSDILAALGRK